MTEDRPSPIVRFSDFEFDLRSRELRRRGVRIAVQERALQVLEALLRTPGQLVTRDALQRELWGGDTFVDFETGLERRRPAPPGGAGRCSGRAEVCGDPAAARLSVHRTGSCGHPVCAACGAASGGCVAGVLARLTNRASARSGNGPALARDGRGGRRRRPGRRHRGVPAQVSPRPARGIDSPGSPHHHRGVRGDADPVSRWDAGGVLMGWRAHRSRRRPRPVAPDYRRRPDGTSADHRGWR